MYFTQYAGPYPGYEWLSLIFIRSMLTANMHCTAGATSGACISKLKEHGLKAILFVAGSYVVAVVLHGTWNYLISSGTAVFLLVVYVLIIFIIFVFGIRGERKLKRGGAR